MIGFGDGMAARAIRKTSQIRKLWPGRDVRSPPAAPPPPERADPSLGEGPAKPSPHELTAHELIAMARSARSRRSPA
ncbi:hypothetical protein [Methylobacterium sp. B4]|uniref:hypothetical protein n=1 Tax=Methylobacterium sp. B4 TaxID=1938755 RepID=UPI000D75275C|nr:hypothetical protein [Methylobacterium sp. B4]